MKVLDSIRSLRVIGDRKLQKMIGEAVKERTDMIMEQGSAVYSEGKELDDLVSRMASGSLKNKKLRKTEALKTYLKERRNVPRVNMAGISTVRTPFRYKRVDEFYLKESYFSRSIVRQIETMLRNGYGIVSEDAKLAKIVRKDLSYMERESNIPLSQTMYRWVKDLQSYGVVVTEKVRKRKRNPEDPLDKRKSRIVRLRPILPHNMAVYVDEYSKVVSVVEAHQWTSSAFRRLKKASQSKIPGIPAQDLAMAYMYDAGGDIFPEPPCFQMLDDILTLRSLEETVELLCFQFGSPLLHSKVGTEKEPSTREEVDQVNATLIAMAPNGMLTTDHRVEINAVNLQRGIANLMPYIEHFKIRVLVGSGSSPISVGEANTANRNTAESIDDALADHCTYLSEIINNMFNNNIIPDILLTNDVNESEIYDGNGDLTVKMEFSEMRLEKQIAKENSIINKWNNSLITLAEARRALQEIPLTKTQEKELHVNKVQIPLKKAGPAAVGQSSSGAANSTKAKTQPSNQYGVKAGPGSRKN
jgi:hypothetical protein